jgi:hypothetical protein
MIIFSFFMNIVFDDQYLNVGFFSYQIHNNGIHIKIVTQFTKINFIESGFFKKQKKSFNDMLILFLDRSIRIGFLIAPNYEFKFHSKRWNHKNP